MAADDMSPGEIGRALTRIEASIVSLNEKIDGPEAVIVRKDFYLAEHKVVVNRLDRLGSTLRTLAFACLAAVGAGFGPWVFHSVVSK